ncbi:MAG: adenylate/guanylate cyclase domain-containing protein [Cyanophyceae cyanobacterium]
MFNRPLHSILDGTILLAVEPPQQLDVLVRIFKTWRSEVCICPRDSHGGLLELALACLPDLVIVSADWSNGAPTASHGEPGHSAEKLAYDPGGLAGYDLCRQINRDPRLGSAPIVLLESPTVSLDRDRTFRCGASDYIAHPIVEQELCHRVRHHIRRHRLEKDAIRRSAQLRVPLRAPVPLLAEVQKRLRKQAHLIQKHNQDLAHEISEREVTEQALRAEKFRSEKLLLSIFPQAIVDRLQDENRSSIAERFDEATILFADIVDFTPLSSRLSPMELVGILNRVFSAFARLTERYGLEKIKTIGDEYMVVGGVPTPRPDHGEAIMEMAIAMRRAANKLGREIGHRLQLRIGINTGPVVAGVIGLQKFSYDLWGDAVNVASRMESHGLPNRIQVTEHTYEKLKHRYKFERWQNTKVKGKGRMTTYLYIGRKENVEPTKFEDGHRLGGKADGAIAPNQPLPNQSALPPKPPDKHYLDVLGINHSGQTEP